MWKQAIAKEVIKYLRFSKSLQVQFWVTGNHMMVSFRVVVECQSHLLRLKETVDALPVKPSIVMKQRTREGLATTSNE